ncbi:MBOAT family O-acyltransferase [Seonamhaeicola aphaedonensis]|uniref:D-alanyl-lipoteichoic acid acyltransferase DltB (MBOAT superfamily) n=1 Tax=Seonamhaeicola aphaedonensis TaxID=1461338 RepID=A0A3D9HFY0_9FLAO|nr:MBOAT family O-acyltransferase [Seonamhaeicola aphaedonensis]RED48374.1 D-alanyl-lipoteichoic acid acyltransferase DltB (MBOAT superfamily) [Seonamhaeicola aphaedonensis]
MLFNSLDFAIYLPIVYAIYWGLNKKLKVQNLFIVLASYVFYGWWDWRFLALITFSTFIDFFVGLLLVKTALTQKKKLLLIVSIVTNLGLLGFFKYYNFFVLNFSQAFLFFGRNIEVDTLKIILPVGISFYTFQTLSYTIDVYRGKVNPTKDFFAFSAFVCFFPQLVAGPIERATNFLPQFLKKRQFDYDLGIDGLRQILWGLFKKVVIADNCAVFVNLIFNQSIEYSGSTYFLGAVFFAFQIYGDFSGYTDIAIGTAKLFGFRLKQNFAYPYFSRDIAEFWRRWHISLTTWFRDYLYIPLGGSRGGKSQTVRNVLIIFLVSGFWHGANWTFIFWGAANALCFLPIILRNKHRKYFKIVADSSVLPSLNEVVRMSTTFLLTTLLWVFFRADSINHAFTIYSEIFSFSMFKVPLFQGIKKALFVIVLIFAFLLVEWHGRKQQFALAKIGFTWYRPFRLALYYVLIIMIFWYSGNQQEFIYFQF